MAYNRDLQEDRHVLFDAMATTIACVRVMKGCIASMDILPGPNLEGDALLATEIADYLSSKGLPFREAHHITGRIVRHCEQGAIGLDALSLEDYQAFHALFEQDIFVWLTPQAAVERRTSRGGTAWVEIERQVALLKGTI